MTPERRSPEPQSVSSLDRQADRQADRQTDMHTQSIYYFSSAFRALHAGRNPVLTMTGSQQSI